MTEEKGRTWEQNGVLAILRLVLFTGCRGHPCRGLRGEEPRFSTETVLFAAVLGGHQHLNCRQLLHHVRAFALRRHDFDIVFCGLADKRAAERRRQRDPVLRAVNFFRHYDLELCDTAFIEVLESYATAEADGVARDRLEVDHRELRDSRFEVADARTQELLALLGHRPFRIFGQVAMRTRAFEFLGQVHGQLMLERLEVFFEPLYYR